jgi:hypothetical protein
MNQSYSHLKTDAMARDQIICSSFRSKHGKTVVLLLVYQASIWEVPEEVQILSTLKASRNKNELLPEAEKSENLESMACEPREL